METMETPLTPPATCSRGSEHAHSVRSMSLTGAPLEDLAMATGGYSRDIDMSKFKVRPEVSHKLCITLMNTKNILCAYVH